MSLENVVNPQTINCRLEKNIVSVLKEHTHDIFLKCRNDIFTSFSRHFILGKRTTAPTQPTRIATKVNA